MARQTGQADRRVGQRMCAGLLGLWALLHAGALMAQGLYIAQVPTVCMTPAAGSRQAVPLPYVVAREVQGGSKVPSQAQACEQMGLKAMKSPEHRDHPSPMKKH
jgi:hypothetical protein